MKLRFPLTNVEIDTVVEDNSNPLKKRRLRGKLKPIPASTVSTEERVPLEEVKSVVPEPVVDAQTTAPTAQEEPLGTETLGPSSENNEPPNLLMVEVVNVLHDKFKKTEEVKVSVDRMLCVEIRLTQTHPNVFSRP